MENILRQISKSIIDTDMAELHHYNFVVMERGVSKYLTSMNFKHN